MNAVSPIRRARAASLEAVLNGTLYRGKLRLTGEVYKHLAALGLSRSEVTAGADLLVREGRATLSVEQGVVALRRTP